MPRPLLFCMKSEKSVCYSVPDNINTYLEAYDCDGIKLTEEGKTLQTSHGANYDGYSGIMSF